MLKALPAWSETGHRSWVKLDDRVDGTLKLREALKTAFVARVQDFEECPVHGDRWVRIFARRLSDH